MPLKRVICFCKRVFPRHATLPIRHVQRRAKGRRSVLHHCLNMASMIFRGLIRRGTEMPIHMRLLFGSQLKHVLVLWCGGCGLYARVCRMHFRSTKSGTDLPRIFGTCIAESVFSNCMACQQLWHVCWEWNVVPPRTRILEYGATWYASLYLFPFLNPKHIYKFLPNYRYLRTVGKAVQHLIRARQ
jgi:hypothetical protein